MRKAIFIALVFILVILSLIVYFLGNFLKKPSVLNEQKITPTPFNSQRNKYGDLSPDNISRIQALKSSLPITSKDFEINYHNPSGKFVVSKKSPKAEEEFNRWIKTNSFEEMINQNLFVMTDKPIENYSDTQQEENKLETIVEVMKILFDFGGGLGTPEEASTTPAIISSIQPTVALTSVNPPTVVNGLIYYPQCGEYGSYRLPGGCSLCESGCGPTTVAMILSSKIDRSYIPPKVVDLYESKGFRLGCPGSGYLSAREILSQLGVKITNLIFATNTPMLASEVIDDMKLYLNNGWTLFTLGVFRTRSGEEIGHYFWIIDIDQNNNIWAFDSYYGRFQIPFNENSYYPYPKYILAFGVK